MTTIQKPNYFVFTGGPGAGKTSVLEELARRHHLVVPEVARAIIQHQQATGGNAMHTGNRLVYRDLMLEKSIADYLQWTNNSEQAIFFDRGIPDLYSYSKRFCNGLTPRVTDAVAQYRYNQTVFLFPAWEEIYCHDAERKQSFQEAIETYDAVKEGYTACQYTLIELPKASIAERVDFILQHVN